VKIAFKTVIESPQERKNYYSLEQYIAIKNNNLKDFEKY
jgi:hypothetical protein